MEAVKVGFIGAGSLANAVHYPSLAEIEEATLVAICDLNQERLNRTADKYNVKKRYTDYKQMLKSEELDAVYVIMPPMGLKDIVVDCLSSGKHVFMEKPPGVTTKDAKEMSAAAKEHGCLTLVGFNRRYAEVFVESKRRVLERGTPTLAISEFHKDMARGGPYYGMSILRTDIIHVVDALRDLLGEPKEVISYVGNYYVDWRNSYNALIRFQNEAVGILTANRVSGARYERFEFHGREIAAYIRAPEIAEVFSDDKSEPIIIKPKSADSRQSYGYLAENQHFIAAIKANKQPLTNIHDAVKTMELVDLIEAGKF